MNAQRPHAVWAIVILAAGLFFQSGLGAAAQTPEPSLEQAQLLIKQRDYQGAVSVLNAYLQSHPKDSRALVARGDAKDYLGDEAGAIADYNAAIAVDPNYEYAYATKCYSEVEIGQNDAASKDCTHALSLNPNDAFAYRGRANAYYFSSDYAAALSDADQAVRLNGNDPYAYLTRCRINAALGKLQQAKDDCTRSIALSPADNTYFARGQILVRLGDYAGAESDLRQTILLNPDYSSAHYWLAVAEAAQKKVAPALDDVNLYLVKHGNDPDGLMLRAVLEARQGNLKATRADAQEALRLYKIAGDDGGAGRAQSLLDKLPKP